MNEEEKKAVETLQGLCTDDCINNDVVQTIVNLINKQQIEIEELKEDNNALVMMIDTANAREYRKKYVEERRKEQPNLYYPDFDEIYERYYKQKAEIEQLKKDYQILKDDIEGYNVVYVDTPECEENYISKNKIKEIKAKWDKSIAWANADDHYYAMKMLDELLGD